MPYYARRHQLTNTLLYHVFNRSNSKVRIFDNQNDYQHFKKLLEDYSSEFKIKIYHWAIMPNHYHLLLEIEDPESISKAMAGINRAYTHYRHKHYLSCGFLWQGRFKLQPVQKEGYLFACGRYIERNPVRAKIVLAAEDYLYSSARFYCAGEFDGLTAEDPTFVHFGAEVSQRRISYSGFLRNFNNEEEVIFTDLDSPAGDKEFIKKLEKKQGRYLPKRRGRPLERIVS